MEDGMINDSILCILEQIPDLSRRKYQLTISDDIVLENGWLDNICGCPISENLLSIELNMCQLLTYNNILLCTIIWETSSIMNTDLILNLFKDHTISSILLVSKGGEFIHYNIHNNGGYATYERFGRYIYTYSSSHMSISDMNIFQIRITKTISSILMGG